MDEMFPAAETNDEISIDRCRELLGDEAAGLSDDDVEQIRRHAETIAHAIEISRQRSAYLGRE